MKTLFLSLLLGVTILTADALPQGEAGPKGWLWWSVSYVDAKGNTKTAEVKLLNKDTKTQAKAKAAVKKAVVKLK